MLARVRVLILKVLGETKCQVDNPTATTKLPAFIRKPSNQGPSAPPQERLPSSPVIGLSLMGGKQPQRGQDFCRKRHSKSEQKLDARKPVRSLQFESVVALTIRISSLPPNPCA